MGFLAGRRVVVTGGAGFLGREVCAAIESHGPASVLAPRSFEYDLRRREAVRRLLRLAEPEVVVHLAAVSGGIEAAHASPGRCFYDNAIMGIQLLEEARLAEVAKLVVVGSIHAYPEQALSPLREEDIWNGYPPQRDAAYGLAQRILLAQAQAYRRQYGTNIIALLPATLYGPCDHFNSESGRLIPTLIRQAIAARDAGRKWIDVDWSGAESLDLLHVRDAARGIARAIEEYNQPEPVNLGTGREITTFELADSICRHCRFNGQIRWTSDGAEPTPSRSLGVTRARSELEFEATIAWEDGLQETVHWYESQRDILVAAPAA